MDKTHTTTFRVSANAFEDDGNGRVLFSNGLTITDSTEQRNGTKYDIASMDMSEYKGQLTANHSDRIQEIIGKITGLRKVANKVVVDGIEFAIKENALARLAYDLLKGGFATDFSVETYGPYPDDEGIYYNSKLIGLSMVVVGNNKSAAVNRIVRNSISESKSLNLDTSIVESEFDMDNSVNNSNEEDKKMSKDQKKETPEVETPKEEQPKEESKAENSLTIDSIKDAFKSEIAPIAEKVEKLEKQAFDKAAKEPEFKQANKATTSLKGMDYESITQNQINGYLDWKIRGSQTGRDLLVEGNKINLEELKKKGIVKNSMTIADFGNFVINPELLSDIEGYRSDFSSVLGLVSFRETLSTQMAWLERSGDISMTSVEFCDDDADGNLKPVKEYTATKRTSNLEELAAVTPVCNAATRFLAVDMIQDVTAGYRLDYDRKKAQLLVARLQQAVNYSGNKTPYNGTTDTTTLQSWIDVSTQEEIMNGVYVFNMKTYGEIKKRMFAAGANGPLSQILTTGDVPTLDGKRYVIVPNELMPSLNSAETKSFTVGGSSVTIDQAVFYFDPMYFKGRISGGLQFDLSTDAAYEIDDTVYSAYQRNELVMRGSFFRGGAITDRDRVTSMYAAGVS